MQVTRLRDYNKYNPWGCCRAKPAPRSKRVRNDRKPRENGPPNRGGNLDFSELPRAILTLSRISAKQKKRLSDPTGIYSGISHSIFIESQRRKRSQRFLATVFWSPKVCPPFSRAVIGGATIATIETTTGVSKYLTLKSIRAAEHLRRHNLHFKLLLIER